MYYNIIRNMDSEEESSLSDEFQYIENSEDDFCVTDIENNKIDELTKMMNNFDLRLINFQNEPLNNISDIRRDFYLLCEDHRYLIDDSKFLSNLESSINKDISFYEDKLFVLSEKLIDDELDEMDKINKTIINKIVSYDNTKEHHERLIFGEALANERKIRRESKR